MKLNEIKTVNYCAIYVNDILDCLMSGEISKDDVLKLFGAYTAYITKNSRLRNE